MMNVAAGALSADTLSMESRRERAPRASRHRTSSASTSTRLVWQRSGDGDGSIEIAFPLSAAWTRGDWVLMRVAGDEAGRILVFDRNEWDCFLDGVRNGEFDDATNLGESDS